MDDIAYCSPKEPCEILNCADCSDDGTTCVECEAGYDPNSDSTECTKKDCSSLENCAVCDTPEGASKMECLQCEEAFLLDQRSTSTTRNTCIAAASCKGVAKPGVGEDGEELRTCVDKACVSVLHCSACDSKTETICADCEDGYTLKGSVCEEKKGGGLSGGAIAGIVIAVIVVVAVVVFLCVWFLVIKKRGSGKSSAA